MSKKKLKVKNQHKIGTAQKRKAVVHKRMNKRLLELEAENAKLKRKLKKCICPHCGYGFEYGKENLK